MSRVIAIGDIHGCARALHRLLEAVNPKAGDTIVTLGDYVDRGPDSKGVIDQLIAVRQKCELIPIMGNHEELMLSARTEETALMIWVANGGLTTLLSYGIGDPKELPADHLEFFESCRNYYEHEKHFMVHACFRPDLSLDDQPPEVLRWERVYQHENPPGPHYTGKIAVLGHTPQEDGGVLDLGHIINIDTYCFGGGYLTALDVVTGDLWQTNEKGECLLGCL